ncbi:MAG: WYL domain-containing protein [Planctomycetota bacterium]
MRERSPLLRQWPLLRLLCARHYGVTVREMAQEMGVTEKTIRRDLEVFREVGFPIEETVGERGRKTWQMKPLVGQPPMSFAFDEAIALYLGQHLLEPLAGTVFWEASRRAYRKIRASLSTQALRYIALFAPLFHQTARGISDYSKKAEMIDQLVQASEERRQTFITYRSLQATESVSYPIYPYGIVNHHGSLYLVGYAPDHEEIRHWKIDRVEDVGLEELRFQRPDDFDLRNHVSGSFGIFQGEGDVHVKVRFSAEVARYVQEKSWHPSQELTPQKGGSLIAEFDLDGTEEIKRWILGFGRHAEVLEPAELRKEAAGELTQSLRAYAEGVPAASANKHAGKRRARRALKAD